MILLQSSIAQSINGQIQEIRSHFNYVEENLKSFKSKKQESFDYSTDGAEITKYFDQDQLVKIRCEFYGETGKLFREMYIKDNQLLFVFDQMYNYNMPYYIDDKKAKETGFESGHDPEKTKLSEHRFYFYDMKLIRWIDPNGTLQAKSNPEWQKKEKDYLEQYDEFK
jgi:uncharacterized protein YacL (UPF0231 family)